MVFYRLQFYQYTVERSGMTHIPLEQDHLVILGPGFGPHDLALKQLPLYPELRCLLTLGIDVIRAVIGMDYEIQNDLRGSHGSVFEILELWNQ